MIKIFENIFPLELCQDLRKVLDLKDLKPLENTVQDGVLSCDLEPSDKPFKNVNELADVMIKDYFSNFMSLPYELYVEGFCLLRYPENTYCKSHCDREWVINDGKETVRLINIIVFLNDDFIAGDLIFDDQKVVVPSKQGNGVGFPCSFLVPHKVSMVLNGVRDVLSLSVAIKNPSKSY